MLDAHHDRHGRDLRPGDRVRSYDFGFLRDSALGKSGIADSAWIEGVLEDFETYEGVPSYRIRTSTQFVRNDEGTVERIEQPEHLVYAPINGTRSALGGVTDSVERID